MSQHPARRASRALTALLFCLLLGVAALPAAHATPAYHGYLDLPSLNGEGERGGGLHPDLPLDEPTLRAALDRARADGIAPRRYATLLHQYWLVVATGNAAIDLTGWDPNRGVAANAPTFNQVYVNYLRLATAHPEFWWAGLAGIAGGSFASGFFDMSDVGGVLDLPGIHQLGNAVADLLRGTPPELAGAVPADIRLLATEGSRLTVADITWYQTRLMIMQRHIFTDLVPMHEAYVARGLAGIDEMLAAGLIDADIHAAWRSIESGTREGYIDALIRMTDREQNHVIADQWDETSGGRGVMGRVLTYVSTVAGKPAVPGVRAPGVFAPVTVRAEVGGRSLALRMPLPDFNWADRDTRWTYITGDLVPRHIDLESNAALAATVLGEPFADKLARGRLLPRLPDLLADLTAHWQLVG
ncbi:hypothetical protein IU433_19840 [Nocardia puris]|uniref:Uncharacterized protein n=1 Tax=Nocardia puris TaxID=208602 RepID=A0A366E287_9NOCA|nr:hypothetical protein [Nocardia puris]MBF6212698.1 hypothetical protein [Nocardia puris]MBF6367636.1 hypothetical protein [Nocardia puris]MBF6461287.1 hypothetical protein [Nocardia puris]RBO96481.1 hypothetical protein DFR74_101496 [Nocardia puris]